MSYLSSLDAEKLERLISQVSRLRRGGNSNNPKPHKLVMLLAVTELFENQILLENKIYFDENLINAFKNIFERIKAFGDWNQVAPPFFHLRTSGFWNHQVLAGREKFYNRLSTSGGGNERILRNIEFAYLSDDAYYVIMTPELRILLRDYLMQQLQDYIIKNAG